MNEIEINKNGYYFILGKNDSINSGEIYFINNRYYKSNEVFWDEGEKCYKPSLKKYLTSTNFDFVKLDNFPYNTYSLKTVIKHNSIRYDENICHVASFKETISKEVNPLNGNTIEEYDYYKLYKKNDSGLHFLNKFNFKKSFEEFPQEIYSMKDLDRFQYNKYLEIYYQKSIKENFKELNNILNKSIGIEYETSAGFVPYKKCLELGIIPFKDGSINNHEYVSLPLFNKVVDRVVNISKHLRYNCSTDRFCSTHIHVGELGRNDRSFIVSLYDLWNTLQNEFYEIIVIDKKSLKYISTKKQEAKDHCKPVPNLYNKDINVYYKNIFALYNNGIYPDHKFTRKSGILTHTNNNKWNINCRYFNLNLIGLFENKGVIEFRIHGPTLNENKLINFIFILNAVIEYAKKHSNVILHKKEKIYLEKIINSIYANNPKIKEPLIQYIRSRKNAYLNNIMNNNIYGSELDDLNIPDNESILVQYGYDIFDNVFEKYLIELDKKYSKNLYDYQYKKNYRIHYLDGFEFDEEEE
jgi:hypothetical protein